MLWNPDFTFYIESVLVTAMDMPGPGTSNIRSFTDTDRTKIESLYRLCVLQFAIITEHASLKIFAATSSLVVDLTIYERCLIAFVVLLLPGCGIVEVSGRDAKSHHRWKNHAGSRKNASCHTNQYQSEGCLLPKRQQPP